MIIEIALACLSLNVYFEARDQPIAGQVAVAQVTMNRVADPRYPDTVCEVVYERDQFSWYWDGKSDYPTEERAWEQAQLVASAVLAGSVHSELEGVTHYHAVYVQPYWSRAEEMNYITQIADHRFYYEVCDVCELSRDETSRKAAQRLDRQMEVQTLLAFRTAATPRGIPEPPFVFQSAGRDWSGSGLDYNSPTENSPGRARTLYGRHRFTELVSENDRRRRDSRNERVVVTRWKTGGISTLILIS